jgi:precorrin-2 dehydrogenase/sirohydrochlorin ferrochelatase
VKTYPIALVGLEDLRCVVVGGGQVAARKVAALREAGARPIVISPMLCEALQRHAEQGEIQVIERAYQTGDATGAHLVIAATDDPGINEAVWQEARSLGCLVNVVDDPARCNFHTPATIRRGELTISISTGGNSPALARRLRQELEAQFDAGYAPYLALLGELRPLVQEQVAEPATRRAVWETLLDSDLLALCRVGEVQAAHDRAIEIIDSLS